MERRRNESRKIVERFHDAFLGLNMGRSACTKSSEFAQQSNCKGNSSNNAGLNGTYSNSASESDIEDLSFDFNNENNKMRQSAKEQIEDQNQNKLDEEQEVNPPVEGDGKVSDHKINRNTASNNTRKKRKDNTSSIPELVGSKQKHFGKKLGAQDSDKLLYN